MWFIRMAMWLIFGRLMHEEWLSRIKVNSDTDEIERRTGVRIKA
jgi:hypothetical protein